MGTNSYDDIIDLPHHVSVKHAHMPLSERAAQFSPFAALTGYEDVIRETEDAQYQRIVEQDIAWERRLEETEE